MNAPGVTLSIVRKSPPGAGRVAVVSLTRFPLFLTFCELEVYCLDMTMGELWGRECSAIDPENRMISIGMPGWRVLLMRGVTTVSM
ncbi:hypothetical protein Tco_0827539 [Tanacetum coccineum]